MTHSQIRTATIILVVMTCWSFPASALQIRVVVAAERVRKASPTASLSATTCQATDIGVDPSIVAYGVVGTTVLTRYQISFERLVIDLPCG